MKPCPKSSPEAHFTDPTARPDDAAGLQSRRRAVGLLLGSAFAALSACGGGGGDAATPPPGAPQPPPPPPPPPPGAPPATKSTKRGIAYDLADNADLSALSAGVSWWYNWSSKPNAAVPTDHRTRYGMDFCPMLWNGDFPDAQIEAWLLARPEVRHLLLMNEPNLVDQANLTPLKAAQLWPRYEAIAAHTGVQLVGPAITWGTMANYADPVVWLDAFYQAYRDANGNRAPQIDALAFHWYDYGLADQLDRLKKYGKPFWVTEFANWHNGDGAAQIDTVDKQKLQMAEMVSVCEARADVVRYAWFTGRWANDTHHTSLLGASGALTALGQHYLSLPFKNTP